MWSEEKIQSYLNKALRPSRIQHTLGVKKAAEELACIYGEDPKKARLAALLHDALKEESGDALIYYLRLHGEEPGPLEKAWKVLHAPAGAIFAKEEVGVTDADVLNAIRYHTTGRPRMSKLEKILFLADLVEEGRHYRGVENLREVTNKSLNEGMLLALNQNLKHLIDSNEPVVPASLEAQNYYAIWDSADEEDSIHDND